MCYVIQEASTYQKKYDCPYCKMRMTRMDLIEHIDEKHHDMIPKGYTATRVVFNLVNKKEHGTCIICKGETDWDESKARYNRLCNKESCRKKYAKMAKKNTQIDKRLQDPEFQQKMLAGRRITGIYKFQDGGEVSYTGSYERKLLEFMDKFLNVKSYDIQTPGPVIEYTFDGSKHKWITDVYYIPYNLVFDVKDGGDHPNTRNMPVYRAKQIAKEKAIKDQGEYNYIRLTDNNFQQLIEIMLELKESFDDPLKKPIIRINENSTMAMNSMPPAGAHDVYIVNYMKKNVFSGEDEERYALSKSYMQDAVTVKNGVYEQIPFEELQEAGLSVRVFRYRNEANYLDLLESAENDTDFYKLLTGKDLLDSDQIQYDSLFEEVMPYTVWLKIMSESCIETILHGTNNGILYEGISIPYFELEDMNESDDIVKFYRDIDGVFLMNEATGFRTKSYDDISILKKYKKDISAILN